MLMETKEKTTVILRTRLANTERPPIPKSWDEMAGAFSTKRRALLQHAKNIRKEWGK